MIINQTVSGGGGSQPVIDTLNVTPTTSAQQITAPQGTDGYSPVNVSAVTSSIDANIQAGNIKNGVTILGTTGTYTGGAVAEPKIMMYTATENNKTVLKRGNQVDLNGAEDIGNYALQYACQGGTSPTITQYALIGTQNLTAISGEKALSYAFSGSYDTAATGLNNVTSITGYMALNYAFQNAWLTTVDLGSLETAELKSSTGSGTSVYSPFYYTFSGCSHLLSADLGSFRHFVYNEGGIPSSTWYGFFHAFENCSQLTSVDLSSFDALLGSDFKQTFVSCHRLTTITYNQAKIASMVSQGIPSGSFYQTFSSCILLLVPYFVKECAGYVSIARDGFNQTFSGCANLTSTGLSNITSLNMTTTSCYKMYGNCTSLTSTGLDNLYIAYCGGSSSTASSLGYMFQGCTGLTSTGLSKVVYAGESGACTFGYMFSGCTGLTNETFTNLAEVIPNNAFYYMFQNCTGLQSLSFPNLNARMLYGNTTFTNMLSGCSNVTVHFPSNAQSIIGSWATVTGGFGGTNTTVLFDLPAEYYITMSDYEYIQIYRMPTEDTATSLAWYYRGSDQMLYTSGTSQPSVGDTLYTDSACTITSGHTVYSVVS